MVSGFWDVRLYIWIVPHGLLMYVRLYVGIVPHGLLMYVSVITSLYIYRPLMYSITCDSIYNFSLNMVSEHRFSRPLPSNFPGPPLLPPSLIALFSSVFFLPVLVSSWCIYQSKPWETTILEPSKIAQSETPRASTRRLKILPPPDVPAVRSLRF
jgi:hypothetical protein